MSIKTFEVTALSLMSVVEVLKITFLVSEILNDKEGRRHLATRRLGYAKNPKQYMHIYKQIYMFNFKSNWICMDIFLAQIAKISLGFNLLVTNLHDSKFFTVLWYT